MNAQQLALNAAQDARLVANAIASGPTVAVLKSAEISARRLAQTLPALMEEISARQAAAREAVRKQRKDQRIIERDAPRLAKRHAAERAGADSFAIPDMPAVA